MMKCPTCHEESNWESFSIGCPFCKEVNDEKEERKRSTSTPSVETNG